MCVVYALVTIKFFVDGGKKNKKKIRVVAAATAVWWFTRVRENLVARNLSCSLIVQGPSVGFFFKFIFPPQVMTSNYAKTKMLKIFSYALI